MAFSLFQSKCCRVGVRAAFDNKVFICFIVKIIVIFLLFNKWCSVPGSALLKLAFIHSIDSIESVAVVLADGSVGVFNPNNSLFSHAATKNVCALIHLAHGIFIFIGRAISNLAI